MKKFKSCLTLALVIGMLASCSGIQHTGKEYSFTYASNLGGDYTEKMYYTDDYFASPATQYNPSLATASLAMAMSSFASNVYSNVNDYSNRYHNNQKLMQTLGFTGYQANQFYQTKPSADSMGVTYCYKPLENDTTLIAIGLRGQGYDMEWSSNFKCGSEGQYDGRHAGFHEASQIALTGLQNFVSSNQITGKIKVWVSGYSRAGACANLLAGTLDEAVRDSQPVLENVTYTKEDVYAYCFEPPMGAYLDENNTPHGQDFSNIFNIVNRADPVPMVAMHDLNFTRYGVDCFLSEPLSDPNYSDDIEKVVSFFDSLNAKDKHGQYVVDDFVLRGMEKDGDKTKLGTNSSFVHWTQGQFLTRFIHYLTTLGVKTREDYVDHFQDGLTSLLAMVYSQAGAKASLIDIGVQVVRQILQNSETDVLIEDLLHQIDYFVKDLVPIVQQSFQTMGLDILATDLEKGIIALLKAVGLTFLHDINLLFTVLSIDNDKGLGFAHYPDVCLANMMARDPNYTLTPVTSSLTGEYYVFTMDASTQNANITVKSQDEVVASFVNSAPVSVESTIAYGIEDGMMQIFLPKDGEYTISYDQGEPTVSLYHPNQFTYEEITCDIKKADGLSTISL